MKRIHSLFFAALVAASLPVQATMLVTVDTSGLIAHPAGPFHLAFQFNDGTGAHDNTVTLSHFDFHGGSAVGAAEGYGGVSGDLVSGITLTDSEPFNELYQRFAPGARLSFHLSMTSVFTGLIPDVFGFAILDADLFNLATFAWGGDQFLIATLGAAGPELVAFGSLDGSVPAPRVPDHGGTLALIAIAAVGLGLGHRAVTRRTCAPSGS